MRDNIEWEILIFFHHKDIAEKCNIFSNFLLIYFKMRSKLYLLCEKSVWCVGWFNSKLKEKCSFCYRLQNGVSVFFFTRWWPAILFGATYFLLFLDIIAFSVYSLLCWSTFAFCDYFGAWNTFSKVLWMLEDFVYVIDRSVLVYFDKTKPNSRNSANFTVPMINNRVNISESKFVIKKNAKKIGRSSPFVFFLPAKDNS